MAKRLVTNHNAEKINLHFQYQESSDFTLIIPSKCISEAIICPPIQWEVHNHCNKMNLIKIVATIIWLNL